MDTGVLLESLGHAAGAVPFAGGPYLVAVLLMIAAYAPGRSLAGEMAPFSPVERWAFSTGLGLAALGTLLFALGLAGWFTRPAVATALALVQLPWVAVWVVARRRKGRLRWRPPAGATVATGAGAVALVLFVGTLALYPPLGFDATLYHLPTAQALVEGHRLPFLADSRVPVFPQLTEVLFGAALLFGDDRAVRLLELAMTALTAVALFGWVRRRASAATGLWAAALWAGSPFVVLFGSDAYVEGTLALFAVLAILALDGWREDRAARWPWVAGALVGAAAATKYLGLFFVAMVPLAFLIAARSRRGVRAAAIVVLAAVVVAGPWYGRITLLTGNPVFPFFPEVFGATDWAPFVGTGSPSDPSAQGAMAVLGSGLRRVAVGSGDDWRTWSGPPAFDPFLWVLAPAVLLLARRPRAPLFPIVVGLAYAPAVWLLAPEPRYLLPALPWACAAVALGLDRLIAAASPPEGWARRAAAVALALLLAAPGAGYAAYRIARQGPVPRAAEAREAFLALRRPGYGAIRYLDRRLGGDYTLYNLGGESLRYFVEGRYLGDWSGPAPFGDVLDAAAKGAEPLAVELRALDADYLLVVTRPEATVDPLGAVGPLPGFRLIYRDAGSRLYEVPAVAELNATTPGASPPPRRARPSARTRGSGRSAGGAG